MYVANVEEGGFTNNPHLDAVRDARRDRRRGWWCRCARPSKPRSRSSTKPIAPSSSKDLGLHEPGLDRVIRAAYQLLGPADLSSPPA